MTQPMLRVGFFCALFTVQCCVTVIGTISRDTIFLRCYAASNIAALTLLLSFTTAYALTTASSHLAKLAAINTPANIVYAIAPAVLAVGLLILSLASLWLPLLSRGVSVAIYIWLEISMQLLAQQFWDLCAKAFDVSQSKKYFGFITFGTTFGSLLASFVVLPSIQQQKLPTEYNLIGAALMQLFVAVVLYCSADHFTPTTESNGVGKTIGKGTSKVARTSPRNAGITSPSNDTDSSVTIIAEIQTRTYLKHICFFDMLATVARVLVDNQTLSVLSFLDENEVKSSLTMINGVQSFLMIPMQLASGPFFTHFGVMYAIGMLPLTVFLFGASTYTSSSAYSLIFSRALYNAISQAIFNPARELLWLPFNACERLRFKSFVYGPFRSLSRIFGAVFSMILTSEIAVRLFGTTSLSVIMIVSSVVWFIDALAAQKSYAAEFYSSLRQGYLDLSSPLIDFTPDQVTLVKETLLNGAQNQVSYVLSLLSHEHISLFSQELRTLFYKKSHDNLPLTPLHTKLRLISLHTAAKRQFVLESQESYLQPDPSSYPMGIFNAMDLMMMVMDKSTAIPRQLRVAAILACGYEKFNTDSDQCFEMLQKLMQSKDEDKSVVVCAAVALLRLSEWMDETANIILQKLLHEEKELESRVVGLKIIGKELPELLGDGYLVYLLNHYSSQIVQAAVECCSHSSRNSRMLIPALVKHLPNSVHRSQIVAALKWFDPTALWGTLYQFTETTVQASLSEVPADAVQQSQHRRESIAGALEVLKVCSFPLEDKLGLLMHLISSLIVSPVTRKRSVTESTQANDVDILHHLFSKDAVVEELVIDALLALIATTNEKTMHTYSQLMNDLHLALDIKIREAYEMRHVLKLFNLICPRSSNIEETSPLLLQHVEHSLNDTLRVLLKLLSAGFPREFNVAVILEGLRSDIAQVHSAIQEVLDNLLPSSYKSLVLPLLFSKTSSTKATTKMEKEVTAFFCGKNGVDILLDVMKNQQPQLELSSLALQYFLHIAADHAEFLNDDMKSIFRDDIIPQLLKHELTKELLIETYHSSPNVLPYESLAVLRESEPPLISQIAISNCLRASSLFENVCAIGILRVLSHHFVPKSIKRGETFAREGDLATAMYVVAAGTVQLHKERRILAELGFGTCIGQAALLRYNRCAGKHVASASALTDCILLSVTRDDLDSLMKETPRVSRGVLNAVASSLRWLYFEPMHAIAQSGSLPRRGRTTSLSSLLAGTDVDATHPVLRMTESLATNLKAAWSVDRAAKSFLYNVGRSRTSEPAAPLSFPVNRSRNRSLSSTMRSVSMPSTLNRAMFGLADSNDFTNFEKCIHLKGSQLVKNLDDDKVAQVAQLSKALTLEHGEILFTDGEAAEFVYVIIEGTVAITTSDLNGESVVELRDGDCFGEESFVPHTKMRGTAKAVGRSALFEIPTKELIELSELHHDVMHVIVAWLSQKLAASTETMLVPLLSPTYSQTPSFDLNEETESETSQRTMFVSKRISKDRAETD